MPVNCFKWVEETSQFNEDFIKSNIEDSTEGYFFEVDVQHPKKLNDLHNDLPFLPERMKIEKVGKFLTKLHDKKEYVKYIKKIKASIKSWISINQKA